MSEKTPVSIDFQAIAEVTGLSIEYLQKMFAPKPPQTLVDVRKGVKQERENREIATDARLNEEKSKS